MCALVGKLLMHGAPMKFLEIAFSYKYSEEISSDLPHHVRK